MALAVKASRKVGSRAEIGAGHVEVGGKQDYVCGGSGASAQKGSELCGGGYDGRRGCQFQGAKVASGTTCGFQGVSGRLIVELAAGADDHADTLVFTGIHDGRIAASRAGQADGHGIGVFASEGAAVQHADGHVVHAFGDGEFQQAGHVAEAEGLTPAALSPHHESCGIGADGDILLPGDALADHSVV